MTRRLLYVILVLLFLSLACSFSLQSKPAGKIIYQSDEYANIEILSHDLRTGSTKRLTNNSSSDVSPAYISSSNTIGFVSDQNKSWNLFTMDMDGGNLKQIIDDEDIHLDYPAWSPDGMLVAASLVKDCTSESESCMYDLYTMRSDGGGLKKLSDTDESEWVPAWSPDGLKIAFSSDRDGDSEVYVIDASGMNLKQLTDNDGYDGHPGWSPDGAKISFETDRGGSDWDIYIMDADGKNPQPVTANSTNDFWQSWSPDGNWFVFVSDADGDNEIFIIDVKGQNLQQITDNTYNDSAPIWAP